LNDCVLQKMKGYIERNERQISMLNTQLQSQAREIEELRAYVKRLVLKGAAGVSDAASAQVYDMGGGGANSTSGESDLGLVPTTEKVEKY